MLWGLESERCHGEPLSVKTAKVAAADLPRGPQMNTKPPLVPPPPILQKHNSSVQKVLSIICYLQMLSIAFVLDNSLILEQLICPEGLWTNNRHCGIDIVGQDGCKPGHYERCSLLLKSISRCTITISQQFLPFAGVVCNRGKSQLACSVLISHHLLLTVKLFIDASCKYATKTKKIASNICKHTYNSPNVNGLTSPLLFLT